MNHLYTSHPALYERDYEPEGFEWINCTSDRDNIVVFSRSAEKKEDTLVFVCNFGINCYEAFGLGVPFAGEYKEILNSDAEEFGGTAQINAKPIKSCLIEKDNRENSISIRLAPMSVCVFAGTPEMQEMSPETNTNVELKDEEIGIPGIVLGKLSEKVGKLIKKNK